MMKRVIVAFAALLVFAACGEKRASTPVADGGEGPAVTPPVAEAGVADSTAMAEVQAYLKECGAFFIATTDSGQPRVRPFGVSEIIDGRLYIMTGKVKDVYKQMAADGRFEICALKPSGTEWMRLSGTLVGDETLTVKQEFLNRNEGLRAMYKADDDNMAVLYITGATARFCSFSEPERRVNF